jgi:uncharacterized protein
VSRRTLLVAVLSAVVFWQLRSLPLPAAVLLTALLVPMPLVLVAQARLSLDIESMPRMRIYVETMLSLWLIAAVTAIVVGFSGFRPPQLGLTGVPIAPLLAWTGAATVAGVLVMFLFRALGRRENSLVAHLMPATRREQVAFAALSATAGICEEFVFRGFMLFSLLLATDSWIIAVVVSTGTFGIVHAYQQPAGAVRAGVLGAVLVAPVVATGSILPAVLAHTLIDLLAGFVLKDRLLRD